MRDGLAFDDWFNTILSMLLSDAQDDVLQSTLADFVGLDAFEFLQDLLSSRAMIKQEMQVMESVIPFIEARPSIVQPTTNASRGGTGVTVMTNTEKAQAK